MAARDTPKPPSGRPVYDCARRKPQVDPRGHATWQFIKHHGRKLALDPHMRAELAQLSYIGELTDRQVEAGFLIARLYGEYERLHGKSRSVRSASYGRAYGRSDYVENPTRSRNIERRYAKLRDCFEVLPTGQQVDAIRAVVEKVCVENRPISWGEIDGLAPMLEYVAASFGLPGASSEPRLTAVSIAVQRPRRRERVAALHRNNIIRDHWLECNRELHPEWSEDDLQAEWQALERKAHALKERARFRDEKSKNIKNIKLSS